MVAAGAAAALGLPPIATGAIVDRTPSMLAPRDATSDTTPVFVWSPARDLEDPLARYELVIDGNPPIHVPAGTNFHVLPDAQALFLGPHSWVVTAVENDGDRHARAPEGFTIEPTLLGPPTVTGPPPLTNDPTPTVNWVAPPGSPVVPGFNWEVLRTGANEVAVDSEAGTLSDSATFQTLADGTYAFSVSLARDLPMSFGSANAVLLFTVDTTAPGAATVVTRPAQVSTDTQATFSWTGEPGASYVWRLLATGGTVAQGPTLTQATTVTIPVVPGSYVFEVAQIDAAGNIGATTPPEPFTVQAVATTPTPTTPTPTTPTPTEPTNPDPPDPGDEEDPPATRNASAMTPRAGAAFSALRPTLRWPARRGAQLYNVQIFRVNGEELEKVVSAFPRNNIFKVPPRRLRAGFRYIWRIWPFVNGGYPNQPLGLSYFDVTAGASGGGGGGDARLRRQMLIGQRISQAAVRRLNAVQQWLDQGLVAGDIIGGGIGRADLAPSIITGPSVPPHAVEEASPRPIVPDAPGERSNATGLRVSVNQLRINQRISSAAVRRANALEARLERGLTGGDLQGAVITLGKLEPGLQVVSALPGVAPPASQTILAPLGQPSGRVRITRKQLRINQRISSAAVRRANDLIERLERGVSGADFQDGSIATANLVQAIR